MQKILNTFWQVKRCVYGGVDIFLPERFDFLPL